MERNYLASIFFYQIYYINIILPLFYINFIIKLVLIKPYLFKHLEIKIAIKSVNQTNNMYKSNYSQNLLDIYSMFMVISQFKLIGNSIALKYQKIENSV